MGEHVWYSKEAAAETGMSFRTLDYYARRLGLGETEGSGDPRWFTQAEIDRLKAIQSELQRHRLAMRPLLGTPIRSANEVSNPGRLRARA